MTYAAIARWVLRAQVNVPSAATSGRDVAGWKAGSPANRNHGVTVLPAGRVVLPVTTMVPPLRVPVMTMVGGRRRNGVTALLGAEGTDHPAPLSAVTVTV